MQKGFTFVEILIVSAITLILISLSVISLSNVRNSASQNSTLEVLLSDIKLQQTKSMSGDTFGETTAQPFGVYFATNSYTLFRGASYSAADPTNFTISLTPDLEFADISFPSSTLLFARGNGEVVNFTEENNTVTLRNTVSNQDTVITINKYGVFTSAE